MTDGEQEAEAVREPRRRVRDATMFERQLDERRFEGGSRESAAS
jgi:hypothetical protein